MNQNKKIKVKEDRLQEPHTFEFQNTDSSSQFSLASFSESTSIQIIDKTQDEVVFDLIGIEPPLANALRRILLSEIPTMAIELVNMYQNTSVIPDEVLSHRLGLVPIYADALEFQYKKDNEELNEFNSLHFKLNAKCERKPNGEIVNQEVYSNQIVWVPKGQQEKTFVGSDTIRVVYDDILLAKLRPGQEIDAELICMKGIGKTHAKWSPVSTAYYRLLPCIDFKKEILNEDAIALKKLCPMKVFDIEDYGDDKRAVVGNARNCTTCRECIRPDKFKDIVNLGKVRDHYEFHIESVGMYDPESLFFRALNILKEKSDMWISIISEKTNPTERKVSINK